MDHDQRLKTLIKEFLREFFQLFFPEWGAVFDFRRIVWLEQELFSDPPDGARRVADLVAQLPTVVPIRISAETAERHFIALIHLELEANDSVAVLRRRMHRYYSGFRERHDCPVLPIAMYVNVGLDGVGTEVLSERFETEGGKASLETLTFRYMYVGLPALAAENYVECGNPLGAALSSLMKTPRGQLVAMKAKALREIARTCHNKRQRALLSECVQAYKPLNDVQLVELKHLIQTPPYREARKMAVTFFEEGVQKGRQEGHREALKIVLEERFGSLPDRVVKIIDDWPEKALRRLAQAVACSKSLNDLKTYGRQK